MNSTQDPLDEAIGLLKARSQGCAPTNAGFEELVTRTPVKAVSANRSKVVRSVLGVLACAAIGGGVVIAAGGMQQLAEYLGFPVRVTFTTDDGESTTVDGVLDGNQLRNEDGRLIPELRDVRVEHIENPDVFVFRGRQEDVEQVTSIEALNDGNQGGNVVNEDEAVDQPSSNSGRR